jgi:NO-binding membrane sensor protein with MHYT domain
MARKGDDVAEIDHFTYGMITPILAYALSVLGSLLGLTCTARARLAASTGRRAWFLLLAAWAIGGTGIWVMHFIAMLGFGVSGSEIRYDVPVTTASAVIAVGVVAVGLFTAGFGRPRPLKILVGGVFAGLGVASMHYTGMAAMQIDGTVVYDDLLVAASVAIAVVAATVALWFTVTVRRPAAIVASALVMGVAVTGMHYTGMFAMDVHLHEGDAQRLTGSSVFGLILPIILLVIFVVIGLIYAVLAAPTDEDRAGTAYVNSRLAGRPAAGSRPVAPEPDPVGLRGVRGPTAGAPGAPTAPGGPGGPGGPGAPTAPTAGNGNGAGSGTAPSGSGTGTGGTGGNADQPGPLPRRRPTAPVSARTYRRA